MQLHAHYVRRRAKHTWFVGPSSAPSAYATDMQRAVPRDFSAVDPRTFVPAYKSRVKSPPAAAGQWGALIGTDYYVHNSVLAGKHAGVWSRPAGGPSEDKVEPAAPTDPKMPNSSQKRREMIKQRQERLDKLRKSQFADGAAGVDETDKRNAEYLAEIQQLSESLRAAEDEVRLLRARVHQLEQGNSDLSAQVRELISDSRRSRLAHEHRLASDMETNARAMQAIKRAHKAVIQAHVVQIGRLQAENNTLRAAVAASAPGSPRRRVADTVQLEARAKEAESLLASTLEELDSTRAENAALMDAVGRARADAEEARREAATFRIRKTDVENAERELAEALRTSRDQARTIARLEDELTRMNTQFAEVREEFDARADEIRRQAKVEAREEAMEGAVSPDRRKSEAHEDAIHRLKMLVAELEADNSRLRAEAGTRFSSATSTSVLSPEHAELRRSARLVRKSNRDPP